MFQNASQIVQGDLVEVAGNPSARCRKLALTPQGQAELTLNINNEAYTPLRQGTQATIREASLSGIANRYVDLHARAAQRRQDRPARGHRRPATRPARSTSTRSSTRSTAPPARACRTCSWARPRSTRTPAPVAQKAFPYLNPAIAASSTLFNEINRNTGPVHQLHRQDRQPGHRPRPALERPERPDPAPVHDHRGPGRPARRRSAPSLQRAARLHAPGQHDVRQPAQRARRPDPAGQRLQAGGAQAPEAARPAAPAGRRTRSPPSATCRNIISKPGANNDLTDLTRLGVPAGRRHGAQHQRRRQARARAPSRSRSRRSTSPPRAGHRPPLRGRPDRLVRGLHPPGRRRRQRRLQPGRPDRRRRLDLQRRAQPPATAAACSPIPPLLPLRQRVSPSAPSGVRASLTTGQGDRCPGSMERGAVYYPESGYPCNPSEVPTGK